MKKRLFACTILLFIFSIKSFAQTNEQSIENDKKAQRLTNIYVKSANVVLPDSVYTILKEFAKNKNLPIDRVMKQQYGLKMIYNTALSIEERLLACQLLTSIYSGIEPVGPLFLVNNMKKMLTSTTN